MLILHPKIYLDPQGQTTDALLTDGKRVIATGALAKQLGKDHEQRSPDGECLMPALTDAHAHPWGLSQYPDTISLAKLNSTQALYDALESHRDTFEPERWLIGTHWDQHDWQDADALSLAKLDELYPKTPLLLYRIDYHAIWCNSAALRLAGLPITDKTTGRLVDEAMRPVLKALGPTNAQDDEAMLLEHAKRLRRLGVTCVHQAYMSVERVEMLLKLKAHGELPIRVYGMVDGMDPALPSLLERGPYHDPDAMASTGCIKFFADGAMGSRGAMMLEPYLDGSVGDPVVPMSLLQEQIPALMAQGWQVATHAIGDRAAAELLEVYALVPQAQRQQLRPRHEHAQIMTDASIERLGELEVIASIQPIHLFSDMPWAHRVMQPHQVERLYRFADLNRVSQLAAGSDFPIDDPNPWKGMATAMSRVAANGQAYHLDQALTFKQILAAYTTGAAYSGHWEQHLGQLHPGFVADIIALPLDPFAASADELRGCLPLETITALPPLS